MAAINRVLQDSLSTNSKPQAYIGDPFPAAPAFVVVETPTAFKDALVLPELDLKAVDTLLLFVVAEKGGADAIQLRAIFCDNPGFSDAEGFQEGREDNATAGEVRFENIVHSFPANFKGFVEITRLSRFCRIQHRGTGTPDGNSKIAVGLVGQVRAK